jgi:hypothetical protein
MPPTVPYNLEQSMNDDDICYVYRAMFPEILRILSISGVNMAGIVLDLGISLAKRSQ